MVYKVLLVGTGITSAMTALFLRNKLKQNINLVLWDKARGIGGRLSTSRSPYDGNCVADLGAQYLTLSQERFSKHKDIYDSFLSENLLEPLCSKIEGMKDMPLGTQDFVAPNGMNSLVKHVLHNVADNICFEHHVSDISSQGNKWLVQTVSGVQDLYDVVVLTMPVPQILQLKGSIQEVVMKDTGVYNNLKSVKYSSRYALGMFYSSDDKIEMSWDAKYIYDNDIFRFVSLDNRKRNREHSPMAAVFQTSIQYGAENIERDLKEIETELICQVGKMYPNWPEPSHVKCHRWRYSQVVAPYSGKPGCVTLSEEPLLLAGGDGFISSHIDDCISSAISLADTVATKLNC